MRRLIVYMYVVVDVEGELPIAGHSPDTLAGTHAVLDGVDVKPVRLRNGALITPRVKQFVGTVSADVAQMEV